MVNKKLQELIVNAENSIHNTLTRYSNSTDSKLVKKASLLSYWLKDYMRMLKKEESFKPAMLKKYKRGDILKVHLGFNIGHEEGGLH
ncbi:MAG: type II toxin-antitoxin system PemK/MazF family toxin, partial [Lachnospiraceae bacterium]|nr:type II toxin-antitoxin system PemK/MazF family toxin [Lachnospiraceae bacterium]